MKYILTILALFTFHLAVGQVEHTQKDLLSIYLNRQFDSLRADRKIADLEQKVNFKLTSIASCLTLSFRGALNDEETKAICNRLEEISLTFFNESTPIIISLGGMGNTDRAEKLNKKRNKFNVTFIALGDGCILFENHLQFQQAFNDQTLKLLGISAIDQIEE